MNKKQALELLNELMNDQDNILLKQDAHYEWNIVILKESFYSDAFEKILAFTKKHKMFFVIKGNALELHEDTGFTTVNQKEKAKT
jgi:hypothetical protein